MYVKSLTLKGFKSFASSTTMRLEPGITCIVGPNGSGKSNIIDALSWVLGEQGAKNLRGTTMGDVIFAGTTDRVALGRAEVTVTIDNTSGDGGSEISITRRMFRDGASEYEINGVASRLIDVQELLSDSGIGKELHVIVGQGQVAQILQSRAEDRRSFIEEAAGVLKHRKRKERAERKLHGTATNINRLSDLTAELRRQLKPLGRQAQAAKTAEVVAQRLRDAQLRIAADNIESHRQAFNNVTLDEGAYARELAECELAIERLGAQYSAASSELNSVSASRAALQRGAQNMQVELEKAKASLRIVQDRERYLAAPVDIPESRAEELLEAAKEALRAETELTEVIAQHSGAAAQAENKVRELEKQARDAEQAHQNLTQSLADQREKIALLKGKVENFELQKERLGEKLAQLQSRKAQLEVASREYQHELDSSLAIIARYDEAEVTLNNLYDTSDANRSELSDRLAGLMARDRQLALEITNTEALINALVATSEPRGGAHHLVTRQSLRELTAVVNIRPGYETAIAVALGEISGALIAGSIGDARSALQELASSKAGRAAIIVPSETASREESLTDLPQGLYWASTLIEADKDVLTPLVSWLNNIIIADDDEQAMHYLSEHPRSKIYTVSGHVYALGVCIGGSEAPRSNLESAALIAQHKQRIAQLKEEKTLAEQDFSRVQISLAQADKATGEAFDALSDFDHQYVDLYEKLARGRERVRQSHQDLIATAEGIEQVQKDLDSLVDLAGTVSQELQAVGNPDQSDVGMKIALDNNVRLREELAAKLAEARAAHVEAQLQVRSSQERLSGLSGKAARLKAQAQHEQQRVKDSLLQSRKRAEKCEFARRIIHYGQLLVAHLTESLEHIQHEVGGYSQRAQVLTEQVTQLETQRAQAQRQAELLRDENHKKQLMRTQAQLQLEQLYEQVMNNYGISAEVLLSDYAPHVPLEPTAEELAEYELQKERGEQVIRPQGSAYVREEQEKIVRECTAQLRDIGTVNPLALEEFHALEERYNFLSTQLDDVKKARADLESVISDIDAHIEKMFTEAYHDVAREFGAVFETLFPGGKGWLELTNPADMSTSGFEIHARPAGKKIARLSLLSGGEKSLTAVALLVAIFRARPSPFYVMDEVEAALDETNLRRLISLFKELRSTSQLLIITHQKLMMEAADALYGISMRGDGITTVVSHKLS